MTNWFSLFKVPFARTLVALALASTVSAPAVDSSYAQDISHSMCLDATTDCHIEGSAVRLAVRLGSGTTRIAGAQMVLQYDPTRFRLVASLPGQSCDPESPFVNVVSRIVDNLAGDLFLAISVNPGGTTTSTLGPATLACLVFEAHSDMDGDICLIEGQSPKLTLLADEFGGSIPVDNSVDCPSPDDDILGCQSVNVGATCSCPDGDVDCSHLDSTCGLGLCQPTPAPASCVIQPQNAGQPCDDATTCTTNEVCVAGHCVGENNGCPSLCLEIDEDCHFPSGLMTGRILLDPGNEGIVAGQFSVRYDPDQYELVEIGPGAACDPDSPFVFQAAEQANPALGEMFYSVTINPFGPNIGATAGTTLACVTFRLAGPLRDEICLFSGANPFTAQLVNRYGDGVPIYNGQACPTEQGYPTLACDLGCIPVPVASEWGLALLTLALLIVAKLAFGASRGAPDELLAK